MRLLSALLLPALALAATLAQADTLKVLTTGAFKQVVAADSVAPLARVAIGWP